MEIAWKWTIFLFDLLLVHLCNGYPIDLEYTVADERTQLLTGLVAVLLTVCSLVLLVGCLCCQRRNRFKQFHDNAVVASAGSDIDHGHINPVANGEFTIFTPLSPPHFNNNIFLASDQIITRSFENHIYDGFDLSSWFNESEKDFPRIKLKYIKELGKGWFGKVVEGAAQDVEKELSWTPVVVRILDATSSQKEKLLFLQDASIYRCGTHPNILLLIGKCLDTVPFLLLQEYCPQGDLKKYLRSNRNNAEGLLSSEYPLLWCCQLTSALNHLHKNKVAHSDLAARNCLLSSNLTLKLGDYGLGIYNYPDDYYQSLPGVPVRWCAPESLNCTQTTIQPKKASPESNVWSLGVTMWEICECGEQPYPMLSDDDVISKVLGPPHIRLERPSYSVLYTDYIFRLMQLCWTTNAESRATVTQIDLMLSDLLQVLRNTTNNVKNDSLLSVDDFDSRWQSLKPNYIVKTDHISDSVSVEINDSDIIMKSLSPSLNNLLLENGPPVDCYIEDELKCKLTKKNNLIVSDVSGSSDSEQEEYHKNTNSKSKQDKEEKFFTNPFSDLSFFQRMSSGSETEDENWRNKVERGAYTEKVRMKSRSVADLMVLTTVDYSESESETPLPSLDYRVNYKNVRYAPSNNLENINLTFGSEGNLLSVEDTFQEELKKLKEERRDSLLFVPDNNSQSIFPNPESNVVNTSRLIEELNDTTGIKPANQVFNVFNVTITNYSPIHVKNKLNDIIFRDDFAHCKSGQSVDVDMGCEQTQVLPTYKNHMYKNESCDSNLNDISVLSCEFDNFCNNVARNEKYPVVISNPEFDASEDSIMHYVRTNNDSKLEEEKPKYHEVVNFSCNLVDEILDEAKFIVKKESLERLSPDINVFREDLDISIKHDEFQVLGSETLSCANLNEPSSITNSETPNSDFFNSNESHSSNRINNNITQDCCKLLLAEEVDKDIIYNNGQKSNSNTESSTPDNIENNTINIIQPSVEPLFQTCTTMDLEVSKKHSEIGILNKYESQLLENVEFGDPIPDEIGKAFQSVETSHQNNVNNKLLNENESGNISVLDPQCDFRPECPSLNTIETEKHINADCQILNNNNKEYFNSLTAKEIVSEEVEPSSNLKNGICSLVEIETEKRNVVNVLNKSEPVLLKDLKFNYNEPTGYKSVNTDCKHDPLVGNSKCTENKEQNEVEMSSCVDDTNSEPNSDDISTLNDCEPENKHIIVTFDISSNQEEVKPNTLTHSNLFTSTPFRKKELSLPLSHDNDYTSINLFVAKSENTEEFESEFPSLENQDLENKQLNYSLETWDNFLDKTLDQSKNLFDSFSSEPQSLLFVDNNIDVKKAEESVIISEEEFSRVVEEESNVTKTVPDTTFTVVSKEERKTEEVNTTFVIPQPDVEVSIDSWESGGGWFLHPQTSNEEPSGEMEIQASNTDSYVGFGIDEEVMSAIRNELLTKLPHAQGTASERVKDEDEWDCGERSEVFLKYNVYNTPLSPIPEESFIEETSSSNTPKQEIENVDSDWSGHFEAEVFPLDTDSISAHTHESPYKGHLYGHTPSQDSCCSNDTLFNLEELICATTEPEKYCDLPMNNVDELLPNVNEKDVSCKENLNQTYSIEAGMVENQEEISEESTLNNQTKLESSQSVDTLSPAVTKTTPVAIDNFLLKEKEHSSDLLSRPDVIKMNEVKKDNLSFPVTQAVPLPSPEDNPWKQLPASLLNYEKVIAQTSSTLSLENTPVPEYVDIVVKNEDNFNDKSDETEKKIAASILENNINNYDDYVNIVNRQNAKNMLEYDNLNKIHDYSKIFVPNEEYMNSDDENVYGVLTDIRFNGPSDCQLMSTSFSESNNCDEQEWDSGSDSRSSSSGEFIWKEGEHEESLKALRAAPQEMVDDIKPMESITEDFNEESDISSTFSDDDSEIPEFVPSAWDQFAMPGKSALRSPEKTLKNEEKKSKGVWFKKQKYHCIYEYPRESESPILQSNDLWKPQTPNDYKIFTDWEFDGETYIPSSDDSESTIDHTVQKSNAQRNMYQLTSVTDFMPNEPAIDDEFFISSSTQPFEIPSSQFFPGHSNNWMENVTPDSGIDDVIAPNNTMHDSGFFKIIRSVPKLKQLASDAINQKRYTSQNKDMMGGLRHTKNKLKLDLPPSPNAFTAEKLFMIEATPNLEPAIREKPTFTTFGKSRFLVQHVDTPTDESKCKNVSFEALPYKPLFENRDKQNIENKNYNKKLHLEKSIVKNDSTDICKLKIEIVRGEASLLDSADEDSGIESSTLERKLSTAKLS